MAFSFFRLTLTETPHELYCALEKEPVLHGTYRKVGTASCVGKINNHEIWLGFKKGRPSWKYSCHEDLSVCKHILTLARIWDRSRDVPDATNEDTIVLCKGL